MAICLLGMMTATAVSHTPGESPQQMPAESLKDRDPQGNTVKIALLLDTSNSMDGLINQAKAQLWDIVNQFTYARCGNDRRPQLQIALYQYGNDGLPAGEGYLQQVIGFSSDLDVLSEKLFSLKTNGGEEYCGQVIQTSLNRLDWGKKAGDLRLIFIAGNEPFTQGSTDYRDAIANAVEKGVVVNTIYCGNPDQGINTRWKDGADLSGGTYSAIDHNRAIVQLATPYDQLILQLNTRLNTTYISYGAQGAGRRAQQAAQDANAMAMEEVVAVKRAVSKSSSLYNNASWDLVDAAARPDFRVADLEKEQLPAELREKSEDELKRYIAAQTEERRGLQARIQELNAKREAWLADHRSAGENSLQSALMQAVRAQAVTKGYRWE